MCEYHEEVPCPLKTDYVGKKIKVVSKHDDKLYFFTVNNGVKEKKAIWEDLYCMKIQWFEPEADNYMPLTHYNNNLRQISNLRHFTWQDIVDFAEVDRFSSSFAKGGSGDWKHKKNPGGGFPLVTVGGKPYWHDAIGQIPFAVDTFRLKLEDSGNKEMAVKATLLTAQHHPNGQLIATWSPVKDNKYDDYFVLRGAIWASRRYGVREFKERVPDDLGMGGEITRYKAVIDANPPAHWLAEPLSRSTAQNYGLSS